MPRVAMHLRNLKKVCGPGYHMNKRHWNTVVSEGCIPGDGIFSMMDHSYDLVIKDLKKAAKEKLENLKFQLSVMQIMPAASLRP